MDKRFWAIVGVVILVFGGILFVNNRGNDTGSTGDVAATQHYRGNLDSAVTLTEYADFQCPACGVFSSTVKQVQEKYNDTVRFQFRHLPLISIHPNALAAGRAAEAASMQGKFWEMHDIIFENQDSSGRTGWVASNDPLSQYFVGYAEQIGLDVKKFKTDFASATVNDIINADRAAFDETGEQQATPTFFLNGEPVDNSELTGEDGMPSIDAFSAILDEALNANSN